MLDYLLTNSTTSLSTKFDVRTYCWTHWDELLKEIPKENFSGLSENYKSFELSCQYIKKLYTSYKLYFSSDTFMKLCFKTFFYNAKPTFKKCRAKLRGSAKVILFFSKKTT